MNPDTPLTPREETEVRLTALLMGELTPDEAAALEKQMAADPELRDLHARLRQAMELLREATALPEQPAPPVPAQLSAERRERLLAHFKNPAPVPARVIVQPRRDWSWAVPLGLAAALIALLGGTVLMSGFAVRFTRNEELEDFSSGDGLAAEAAPQSTHWSMQPGAVRGYREADERQHAAGGGGAAGEKSARFAFLPPPPPPAAPASAPPDVARIVTATTATPAYKLYSSGEMKPAADAPPAAPSLPAITGGSAISEPFSTAGKVNLSQEIAAFTPADPAGGDRGLAQQADRLTRSKTAAGDTSVTAGKLTVLGSGALVANGNAELPALATADLANTSRGLDQTQTFAGEKSAPAPVAEVAKGGAMAQLRPVADFDSDGTARLADGRMPVLGDIPIVGSLFKEQTAAASRPERAEPDAPAKPGREKVPGEKLATSVGWEGELWEAAKVREAGDAFGLRGTEAYAGRTVSRTAGVERGDASALGWFEKGDGSGALGIDSKLSPKIAEFEGFVDYGSPIQPAGAGAGGIATYDFIAPTAVDGDIELGGAIRDEQGKLDGRKSDSAFGRTPVWNDDESTKLNVNTATEGTVWDGQVQTRREIDLGGDAPLAKLKAAPGEPATAGRAAV